MSIQTVHAKTREHFVDFHGTLGQSYSIAYQNAPFTEPDDGPWFKVFVLPGEQFQVDTGSTTKRYRRVCLLIVQIFDRPEQGDKAVLDLATSVEAYFRTVTRDSHVYGAPRTETIGRRPNGKWWQVNVTCPFYKDEVL